MARSLILSQSQISLSLIRTPVSYSLVFRDSDIQQFVSSSDSIGGAILASDLKNPIADFSYLMGPRFLQAYAAGPFLFA